MIAASRRLCNACRILAGDARFDRSSSRRAVRQSSRRRRGGTTTPRYQPLTVWRRLGPPSEFADKRATSTAIDGSRFAASVRRRVSRRVRGHRRHRQQPRRHQNVLSGDNWISRKIPTTAPQPTATISQNMAVDQAVHRSNGVNKAIRPSTVMAICRSTPTTSVAVRTRPSALEPDQLGVNRGSRPDRRNTSSRRRRPAQSLSAGAAPQRSSAALLGKAFGDRGLANELRTIERGGVSVWP